MIGALIGSDWPESDLAQTPNKSRFRPSSIALDGAGKRLLSGSHNGEIAVIDTDSLELVGRFSLGGNIADIKCLGQNDSSFFLATDHETHELIRFRLDESDQPIIDWRISVCAYPTTIAVRDSELIAVAGKWSRQIAFVLLGDGGTAPAKVLGDKELNFVPGKMQWMKGENQDALFVVDAFGNNTAVIEATRRSKKDNEFITVYDEIPDRRIGGFDLAEGQVVFATQMLNPLARSTRNDVHWGLMVSNNIEAFTVEEFMSDQFNFSKDRSQIPIGGAGEAKSDPESIVVTPSRKVVMALGGANQIALGDLNEMGFAYIHVGARPIALAIDADEKYCYVANQLDGSVTVVDIPEMEAIESIEIEENKVLSEVETGRAAFF